MRGKQQPEYEQYHDLALLPSSVPFFFFSLVAGAVAFSLNHQSLSATEATKTPPLCVSVNRNINRAELCQGTSVIIVDLMVN